MCCPPVSLEEQEDAHDAPPIVCQHGWFRIFARGENCGGFTSTIPRENSKNTSGPGLSNKSSGYRPIGRGDLLQTPQHLVLHRMDSYQAFGGLDGGSLQDQDKGSRYVFSVSDTSLSLATIAGTFLLTALFTFMMIIVTLR